MTSVGKDPVRWYAYGKKINDLNAHHNPVRPGVIDWTDKGGSFLHNSPNLLQIFKVFSIPTAESYNLNSLCYHFIFCLD
jgi:hypothetical protein